MCVCMMFCKCQCIIVICLINNAVQVYPIVEDAIIMPPGGQLAALSAEKVAEIRHVAFEHISWERLEPYLSTDAAITLANEMNSTSKHAEGVAFYKLFNTNLNLTASIGYDFVWGTGSKGVSLDRPIACIYNEMGLMMTKSMLLTGRYM